MAFCEKFFIIISLIISKETVTASEVETFDQKVFELTRMLKNDYVLHITDVPIFEKFVSTPKKEYSFIVLFTVSQNCPMCEFPYQEFMLVAQSHKQSTQSNKLFFGIVDFNQSPGIFKMMHLKTIPAIAVFLANEDIKPYLYIEREIAGYQAETIAFLIAKKVHVKINIQRSSLLTNIINWTVILMPVLYFVFQHNVNDLVEFVRSWHVWALGAVVYCGLLTSGQMYNSIVQPPIIDLSGDLADANVTFQIESYIAALMIILISVGMIVLIEGRGGLKKCKSSRNDSVCVVGLTMVVLCFSIYIYMLKRKFSEQYPYTLLF